MHKDRKVIISLISCFTVTFKMAKLNIQRIELFCGESD